MSEISPEEQIPSSEEHHDEYPEMLIGEATVSDVPDHDPDTFLEDEEVDEE